MKDCLPACLPTSCEDIWRYVLCLLLLLLLLLPSAGST
jgi:hypothetical protein